MWPLFRAFSSCLAVERGGGGVPSPLSLSLCLKLKIEQAESWSQLKFQLKTMSWVSRNVWEIQNIWDSSIMNLIHRFLRIINWERILKTIKLRNKNLIKIIIVFLMRYFISTNRLSIVFPFLLVQIKLFNKKTIIFLMRFLFRCLIVFNSASRIRNLKISFYALHFCTKKNF